MDKNTLYLKWGLVGTAAMAIAYFIIPILLTMALSAVVITLCGLLLLSVWFALPAICEWLAQGSMWLWESAIRTNPLVRMRRDLESDAKDINDMDESIAKQQAGIEKTRDTIDKGRKVMDAADIQRWEEDLNELAQMRVESVEVRGFMEQTYRQNEMAIKKAEAEWEIAKTMSNAAGMFDFSKKNGMKSQGSKVALEAIAQRRSESRARMQAAMSRVKREAGDRNAERGIVTPAAPLGITQQASNVIDIPFRPAAAPVTVSPPPASTGRKLGR